MWILDPQMGCEASEIAVSINGLHLVPGNMKVVPQSVADLYVIA